MPSLSFTAPLLFLCVPVLCMLWYFFCREKIGTLAPNALIQRYTRLPFLAKILWSIRFFLVLFLIAPLAGTSLHSTFFEEVPEKSSIVFIFDISLSMLAEDIAPNRLELGKQIIKALLAYSSPDDLSLIVFAGKAFVTIAHSSDTTGITAAIENIHPWMLQQEKPGLSGTNIGDALLLALETLKTSSYENKYILLMTDGVANIGTPPEVGIEASKKEGIPIYPLGIGGETTDPIFYTDKNGVKKTFRGENGDIDTITLNKEALETMAETTGGDYFGASEENIGEKLDQFFKKRFPKKIIIEKRERTTSAAPFCLGAICLLLIAEMLLRRKIEKKYKLSA